MIIASSTRGFSGRDDVRAPKTASDDLSLACFPEAYATGTLVIRSDGSLVAGCV